MGFRGKSKHGFQAIRFSFVVLVTAASSFILGALYAATQAPRQAPSSVVSTTEASSKTLPFFLRNSLTSLRLAASQSASLAEGQSAPAHPGAYKRQAYTAFIGIFTVDAVGKTYDKRRKAIRETWLSKVGSFPELGSAFIVGKLDDSTAQAKLEREAEEFEDFIFLDMQECYTCLPQKTVAYFEMVAARYAVQWVIKMDDDVYMNPHRLRLAMQQWGRMSADYIGCMKHGLVHGDPESKWFEPAQALVGREYHLNAYGSIYVLAGRILDDVVIPNKDRLRRLANEDTSVGLWMAAFQVRYFEDMRLCQPFCHPAGISFLDNACSGLCKPLVHMYEFHRNINCRRLAPDPLPYMPSFPGHQSFHQMRV